MNIFDKIKEKREDNLVKRIELRKATAEQILKGFEKSTNKQYFLSKISWILDEDTKKNLIEEVRKKCKTDKNFFINNCNELCHNIIFTDVAKDIIMDLFDTQEIISNTKIFSIFGRDYDKVALLKKVDTKSITPETLSVLSQESRYIYINSIDIKDITQEMLNTINDELKTDLAKKYIMNKAIEPQIINNLFSKKTLLNGIKDIIQEDATLFNNRTFEFIPTENKSEITSLAKMQYVIQNTNDEKIYHPVEEMINNDEFTKYFAYRQNNFNIGENEDKNINYRGTANRNTIIEVLSSINEYKNNTELINSFFDSKMVDDKKINLLLRYYITDGEKKEKLTNITQLLEYPDYILNRQINEISSGKSDICKNIIVKNLTGFSYEEYSQYNHMFLESHDIEDIINANNEGEQKLVNIKIVRQIIDLMETMDEVQLKDFATNIVNRNHNELISGDFSLINLRENYKTFLSNVKSEYGKEFNQNLGYSISNTKRIQVNNNPINVHEISGAFKFLMHMTKSDEIQHSLYSQGRTCMSFISEGHYEVATGDECKSDPDTIFFLFDNLPEDLLYASANYNMASNSHGDERSNFMTAENTIQNAEKDIDSTNDSAPKFTEQAYFFEGFDKNGKFVKIYPKAIGTFEKEPSKKTLEVASKYGIDVIKIPEMQENLENMLEKGVVTPGLVKGIHGFSDRIVQILSKKETLTKEEKLSLGLLHNKVNDKMLSNKVEELSKKPVSKGKEDIEELIDDINVSQISNISNETRQMINIINNPEISRGE